MTRSIPLARTPLRGAAQGALTALLLALASPAAHGFLEVLEGAAEVSDLRLKTSTQQSVYARECDSCPMLTLSVDAQTAIYAGNKRVSLASVAQQTRGATVFFHPRTYKVTRIKFWQ